MDTFIFLVWVSFVVALTTSISRANVCECGYIREAVSKEMFDLKVENIRMTSRLETIETAVQKLEQERALTPTKETGGIADQSSASESKKEGFSNIARQKTLNNQLMEALQVEKMERKRLEMKLEDILDIVDTSFKQMEKRVNEVVESNAKKASDEFDEFKRQFTESETELRKDIKNIVEELEHQTDELKIDAAEMENNIANISKDVLELESDLKSVINIALLDQTAVCEPPCSNGGFCLLDGTCKCKAHTKGKRCEKFVCDDSCYEDGGKCIGPGQCYYPGNHRGQYCKHMSDCTCVLGMQRNAKNGLYNVTSPISNEPIEVLCDMETDGGGWTVFQNRLDGSVDFYRKFRDYVKGFGDKNGEFWLGLEYLHTLVSQAAMELRIDVSKSDDTKGHEIFPNFNISAGPFYTLSISLGGVGTIGDSTEDGLSFNNGCAFSTYDNDRDTGPSGWNCAKENTGAWWYCSCMYVHLNGRYCQPAGTRGCGYKGMMYYDFAGLESLKTSRMMFRRQRVR